MIHHYLTIYGENGRVIIESWLQINVFGYRICFWIKRKDITDQDMAFLRQTKAGEPKGTIRMHALSIQA